MRPTYAIINDENILDELGKIIHQVIAVGKDSVRTDIKGLATFDSPRQESKTNLRAESANRLAKLAILVEAALQSIMKVAATDLEEAGFINDMQNALQRIGPSVVKTVPKMV